MTVAEFLSLLGGATCVSTIVVCVLVGLLMWWSGRENGVYDDPNE